MHEATRERLRQYSARMKELSASLLGYPENQTMEYEECFRGLGLMDMCIDNVGDPFGDSLYKVNSREFELEVLEFFAALYKIEEYWGYVTACGTEGNIQGIYIGREAYPEGILYYSQESHYSIPKAAKLLRLDTVMITTLENGEVDPVDFALKLDPSRPAIVVANIGTTMKGAIDDISKIETALAQKGMTEYYIHCDAALSGMILPFIAGAPKISFRSTIGSISISGHKFIGMPFPCGIFLTRQDFSNNIESYVEYVGTLDKTLMGSRSGLAPIFLWYALQERGSTGFSREANQCVENATYLQQKLVDMGYPSWLNDFSSIVYFRKPSESVTRKWQLAVSGDLAHVVVMQHATREKIDEFVEELVREQGE